MKNKLKYININKNNILYIMSDYFWLLKLQIF